MTFVQLEMFLELARTNSMGLCAQNLGVSKPNVSITISNLEEELGVQLFFRLRTGSYLTPAGEQIYQYAKRICHDYDTIRKFGKQQPEPKKTLSILYSEIQNNFIQELLGVLAEHQDEGTVCMTSTPVPHLCDSNTVRNNDFVSGMILKNDSYLLDDFKDEYLIYEILESPLGLVVDKRLVPDSTKGEISDRDLTKYKIVVFVNPPSDSSHSASIYDRWMDRHDLTGKLDITTCTSYLMTIHYLRNGYATIYGEHALHRSRSSEEFAIMSSQADSLSYLRIKPEETVIHYIMIKKYSPFFTDISEALATLFNKLSDEFPKIKALNQNH